MLRIAAGEEVRLLLSLPPRHGKLCGNSVPILTVEGWKVHGDLKKGDYVFGREGKRTCVVECGSYGSASMAVEISDGKITETIKCHPNHEWFVRCRGTGKWTVKETKQLKKEIEELVETRSIFQLDYATTLEFEDDIELPIEPYSFGVWLSNGSKTGSYICHAEDDFEYADEFLKQLKPFGVNQASRNQHKNYSNVWYTRLRGFATFLKEINQYKNKHIPDIYLQASTKQKLDLLAGLIDTDGSVDKETGRVRFINTNEKIIFPVIDILRSLGHRVSVNKVPPQVSTSGVIGRKNVYYVSFYSKFDIPTKIKRKKIVPSNGLRRLRVIKSITDCPPEPGKCIQVEAEDGIYLAGKTLIPTHNSMFVSEHFPAWYLGRFPDKQVMLISYQAEFAKTWGRKARNVFIEHGKNVFGLEVSDETSAADYWGIKDHRGMMTTAGMGGSITGRGADCCAGDCVIHTECGNMRIDELVALKNKPKVLSYNHETGALEYKNVIATRTTSTTEFIEIKTNSGNTLNCTSRHRVYSHQRGYTQAGILGGWETLTTIKKEQRETLFDLWETQKRCWSSLSSLLFGGKEDRLCDGVFSLQNTLCETKSRDRKIFTEWANSFLLQSKMCFHTTKEKMRTLWGTYRKENKSLLWAVPFNQEKRNRINWETFSLQKMRSFYKKYKSLQVLQRCLFTRRLPSFVQTYLRPYIEERQGEMCSLFFEKSSCGSSYRRGSTQQQFGQSDNNVFGVSHRTPQVGTDAISTIKKYSCEEQPVYDIQVEGNSNFFAEGILVHNCLIIDDPIKGREQAMSAKILEDQFDWFGSDVYSRLEPGSSAIIIMTRWATEDLVGMLEKDMRHGGEHWDVLNLPAFAEEDDPLGRELDEALWPERWTRDMLLKKKARMTSYWWTSTHQQRPVPLGGTLIKSEWFQRYKVLPANPDKIVLSLDTAMKEKEINDYTVLGVWYLKDKNYYLAHVTRERINFPKLCDLTKNAYVKYKPHAVLIEDKGSGISLIQQMQKDTSMPTVAINPVVDKVIRMDGETHTIAAGHMFLPEAGTEPWLMDYEDEMLAFPNSARKDQVDMTSQFLMWAREWSTGIVMF